MGATSSKPAADGQPKENRGCASWSNWSNDDETKAKSAAAKDNGKAESKAATPSSLASKPAETQTEMLIRIKEITEAEGVWYTAFERLAGDTKSVLPIDTVVTSVTSVPIDDGKRVRLPSGDEARATIAANIDGNPASINVKSWAKLFLAITSGWSLQRIEISARAASKKISSGDAITEIESILAARRASTDMKDAKAPPSNEKSGQSSIVPEEPVTEPTRPVDVVLAAAAPIVAPVPAKEISAVSPVASAPPAEPEPEPVAAIEPSEPVNGGSSPASPEPVSVTATPVVEEVAPSEPSPKSTTVAAAVAEAAAAVEEPTPTITTNETAEDAPVSPSPSSPELKTPGGSNKKKGKGKQAPAKTPTPPSQPPPPVKQQGSQKNLAATTPKGGAKAETPKGAPAKGKKGKK